MKKKMFYSLLDFHASADMSVQNWFLLVCSSVLNCFLSIHLLFR